MLKDNMNYNNKMFTLDSNVSGILNANFYKKYGIKDRYEKPYFINKM